MKFNLKDRVVIITGGAGLLGEKHAEAVAELGGIPVLFDINEQEVKETANKIEELFGAPAFGFRVDVTSAEEIEDASNIILRKLKRIDVLINNAANNPKMEGRTEREWSRLESFSLDDWNADIFVGLTGAFLCSRIIGSSMAARGRGVILNISSDLGIIAPDQRIYKKDGLEESQQPVKPVTYSVVKHGLIGLTKYLATYWCQDGIRANALCPGGVYNGQSEEFVGKLANLIPLGRMADSDEYKGAIQFLCTDASSYMTGACLVVDGGRSAW